MPPTNLKQPSESKAYFATAPRIAGYTILGTLYKSSVCTIYKARQDRLGRLVALKLLPELPPPSDVALERFNRSAYVFAQVVHANLPVLFETGTADGFHFVALEYCQGVSLQDFLIERGRSSERRAVWVGLQVARALVALHEKGVVHRNLKPKNFLIEGDGRVRVIGLGLAKCDAACFSRNLDTQTIGTPHYMAPEMIRGCYTDPRSDLYALGISLYLMVTGRPPFAKGIPAAVMAKHLYEAPQPVRHLAPELSEEFAALVHELMHKDPERRLESAREAVRRLESLGSRHTYADLCFASVPRSAQAERSLPCAPWVNGIKSLGIFTASLCAVLVLGLLAMGLLKFSPALTGALEPKAFVVPPPAATVMPAAPNHAYAGVPTQSVQLKRDAELARLKELEAVFLRDHWRGIREWESFQRLFPDMPTSVRDEAAQRIVTYRRLAAERLENQTRQPADANGEHMDF